MCSRRVAIFRWSGGRGRKFVGGPVLSFATVRSHVLLIEHMIDYSSNTRANTAYERKARQMTVLITREDPGGPGHACSSPGSGRDGPTVRPRRGGAPGGAPMRYRGTGVLMSRASHRRRPITPVTTVGARAARRADHRVARPGGAVRRGRRRRRLVRAGARHAGRGPGAGRGRRCSSSPTGWRPTRPSATSSTDPRTQPSSTPSSLDAGQTLIAPVG